MNYSKIYFYYDCNRLKQDLQNNILQVLYILLFKVLYIIGIKHSQSFNHGLKMKGLG